MILTGVLVSSLLGSITCARLNKNYLAATSVLAQPDDGDLAIPPHNYSLLVANSPPLEGCKSKYWESTCCCFVDAGILKQNRCMCTKSALACMLTIRISYEKDPSRPIQTLAHMKHRWTSELGYLEGFEEVEDDFCMAAPVVHPQVDSYERPHSCICSTAVGHAVEMDCGSSRTEKVCSVSLCHRWKDNSQVSGLDWKPLLEGRGTCCLSSINAVQDGCPFEETPITEEVATSILSDALQQAHRNTQGTAFVLESAGSLVDDMTASFATAKEKKMSTSRSGSQFFFSGDYRYILKSIHPPEYDVLHELAIPPPNGMSKFEIHNEQNFIWDFALRDVKNCVATEIRIANPEKSQGFALATVISDAFLNIWNYDREMSTRLDAPVLTTAYIRPETGYMAIWCKEISSFMVHRKWAEKSQLCKKAFDPLYILLKDAAEHQNLDLGIVDVIHRDFSLAFEMEKTSVPTPAGSGTILSSCYESRYPATLINDFVMAFRYQASSTWMVVRNSVKLISDALKEHSFTTFYKDNDVFDVKPFPIFSEQRELLFGTYFARNRYWRNWGSVRLNLKNDVDFMQTALSYPLVDYSLLVSTFYVNDSRMVLDYVKMPNCVERPLRNLMFYGKATQGSILICFTVIDMLMEFTFAKVPENALLFNKWSDWGDKIMNMFDCFGSWLRKSCQKYVEYHPRYEGTDLQLPDARLQDVTSYLTGEGRVEVRYSESSTVVKTCCCRPAPAQNMGFCRLADIRNSTSYLFKSTGCGYLMGRGWHAYWRYAKRCVIDAHSADNLRENAIMLSSEASEEEKSRRRLLGTL